MSIKQFQVAPHAHDKIACHMAQVVKEHQQRLQGKNVLGRIYISSQGINAQLSGPAEDAESYASWVEQQPEFKVEHSQI